MSRAAVYLRQSIDATGEGVAVARQRALCDKLARARGMAVVERYVDNDRSATSGQRPAYRRLIADARAGQFEAIVVYHLDRLTRRVADLETVIALGLPVATVTGDLDLTTDQGRMLGRILASVGQGEVERKAKRQVDANAQRVAQGLPLAGRRPFGFEADRITHRPAEAEAIRWSCDELLCGGTLRGVAREWNARGHRTANGRLWAADSVRRVLTRPRVAGLSALGDNEVGPASWREVVPEETWRGVLAVLRDPARRSDVGTERRYYLAGIARCGLCGAPLITGWAHGPGGKRRTLRCRAKAHLVRKAEPIEALVEAVVVARLSRPDAADLLAEPGPDVDTLRREAAALRARRDDLASLVAEGVLDAAAVKARAAPLLERLRSIDEALAPRAAEHPARSLVAAEDVAAAWAGLDVATRSAVVDSLVTITIQPAGRGAQRFDPRTVEITWRTA